MAEGSFVDHFSSSSKLNYYESLNQCREKTNLAFDMSVDTNVEQGMFSRTPSGKISIVPESLRKFHFS